MSFVDSPIGSPYSLNMEQRVPTHDELRKQIEDINPLLVEAIKDVDTTLLDEFAKLSIEEKIEWASQSAKDLSGFTKT